MHIGNMIISVVLFIIFYLIGFSAQKMKDPMNFWSSDFGIIDPDNIKDIKAYNRAIAKIWKYYSISFLIAGGLSFWNAIASMVAYTLISTLGLAICYEKVKEKYMYDTKNYKITKK